MNTLVAVLNHITQPFSQSIAFETTTYPLTWKSERWSNDSNHECNELQGAMWLLFGKLRVIFS